jgi:DNA-binding GntR family transcriptional regulator
MAARPPAHAHLTKSEYAYQELRRRILEDELVPGERLLLRPLADELGLSVMPVRDALRMLEGDGLVTLESHRGATVTEISRDAVMQTISARMWLEVLAVREAAANHTDSSMRAVERGIAAARTAAERTDGAAFTRANRALHEAIEGPASDTLKELIRELWERLWQVRRRVALYETVPDRIPEAQAEHEAIVAGLRARDPDAAGAAMERHRLSTLAAWEAALPRADAAGAAPDAVASGAV